jgi:SNF2 family DNA or RNA helicase
MELLGMDFHAIIGDEVHLIKNPDAIRSQAFYQLSRRKGMGILLLSGTPLVNRPEELAVLQALFEKTPLMIRRLLEDVAPEVPKKKRSYLYIRLRDRAQAEYDRAVDDFERWLRKKKEELLGEGMADAAVERALAAEAFTKFGYLRRLLAESKVPAAVDWVSRAVRVGEPVVVFLEHGETLARLSEGLREQRIRHEIIEGSTPIKKRQRYVTEFQKNKFPVIICTSAGAEGITLHAARHLLLLERALTSASEDQREDRIRRIGQRFPTTIWLLHATGTLDDRLDTIIKTKRVIIRDAIGSEDTAESETATVESLVRDWGKLVDTKARKITELGRTDPLPPLPGPGGTHAIIFSGIRWKKGSAVRWCRMNGYMPISSMDMDTRFKLVINPADLYKPNQFTSFKVCSDVKLLVGKRLSAANEALVKRKHLLQSGKDPKVEKDS